MRAHALAALDCFVKLLRDAHAETSAAARAEGDTAKAGLPGAVPLDIFHVCQLSFLDPAKASAAALAAGDTAKACLPSAFMFVLGNGHGACVAPMRAEATTPRPTSQVLGSSDFPDSLRATTGASVLLGVSCCRKASKFSRPSRIKT